MVVLQYAVKFICGKSKGEILAPGEYWTAINIHNPHIFPVEFVAKMALALPGKPGPMFKLPGTKLQADEAIEIDRKQVTEAIKKRVDFIKGFVVIEASIELDVVAVYTAAGRDQLVETIHIERVSSRPVFKIPDVQVMAK